MLIKTVHVNKTSTPVFNG